MRLATALVIAVLLLPLPAAQAADDLQETVQAFYDGYMKAIPRDATVQWVLTSASVSKSFKKAYKAFMNGEPDFDPVLCGNDYPDAGYVVKNIKEDGATATVTMKSRDPEFQNEFTLEAVKGADGWQIEDIDDFVKSRR